jgi:hypothetical protein
MRFSLAAAVVVLLLPACGTRPAGITEAQLGAEARIANYAKNQRLIHAAERKAYAAEAGAHIETKTAWSLERIKTQAATGKLPDGSPVTPEAIVDGVSDVYAKRDAQRARAAEHVAAIVAKQEETEADLTQAARLLDAVHRFDDVPPVSLEAVPDLIAIIAPFLKAKTEGAANGEK